CEMPGASVHWSGALPKSRAIMAVAHSSRSSRAKCGWCRTTDSISGVSPRCADSMSCASSSASNASWSGSDRAESSAEGTFMEVPCRGLGAADDSMPVRPSCTVVPESTQASRSHVPNQHPRTVNRGVLDGDLHARPDLSGTKLLESIVSDEDALTCQGATDH